MTFWADPLEGALWECCSCEPGAASDPRELEALVPRWERAAVPGTAAGAWTSTGIASMADLAAKVDDLDWWFRSTFAGEGSGSWEMELGGLATVADVWLNGRLVLHSENMFVGYDVATGPLMAENELVIHFAALNPLLEVRRPRPRWKTLLATHQNLRWVRTSLLGRQRGWALTPAPVGPWRPIRLAPEGEPRVCSGRVATSCEGDAGVVEVSLEVGGTAGVPPSARLRVGEVSGALAVRPFDPDDPRGNKPGRVLLEGRLVLENVERWWPHTHGPQPLLSAALELDGRSLELGSVGFRTVEVDRTDNGFRLLVNDVPVFCRGGCWFPVDPVNLWTSDSELRATLELVRAANMNMLRIPGGTVYEDERFWDLCDEFGIMVWQDCMFGYLDPPEDEAFLREVAIELEQVLGRLSRHPSLTVVCGGQEIEEQAAFFGVPREQWRFPLLDEVVPELVTRLVPGVPYVTSSPSGGSQPSQPDVGISHYFGVGSYLRDLSDARMCRSRFVSEGLAFAIPPEPETVDEFFGSPTRAGHDPSWKQALHHDTGRSWDTEDFRDFYVGKLFGLDPHLLRYHDPERALELGRAAVVQIMGSVLTEWRSVGSTCSGGLLVAFRDLVPGAGWGVVDSLGRPKAPWFALRRVLAPVAIMLTDEGLNGLRLHVLNETAFAFKGTVRVELFVVGGLRVEVSEREVELSPRGAQIIDATGMFEGFRDLSYAYRFGPPAYDLVAASLLDSEDGVIGEVVHLPAGLCRPREADLGLSASVEVVDRDLWHLEVTTQRFAQWVSVDVPGFRPDDSWFHLLPGGSRAVTLRPSGSAGVPRGHVRAVNAESPVPISNKG